MDREIWNHSRALQVYSYSRTHLHWSSLRLPNGNTSNFINNNFIISNWCVGDICKSSKKDDSREMNLAHVFGLEEGDSVIELTDKYQRSGQR